MNVTIEVPDNRIADLLCSALEGGSNYWCRIDKYNAPPKGKLFKWDIGIAKDGTVFKHIQYPMSVGGSLVITDTEAEEGDHGGQTQFTLDRMSVQRGILIFATKEPRHFGDFMSENDDATTGDVFLQCCLFAEAIYG